MAVSDLPYSVPAIGGFTDFRNVLEPKNNSIPRPVY